jgi:histone arginine demethylase JMJD6
VFTGADYVGEIERISAHDITPEDFAQKYIKRGMPVVLTNAMDAWPAFREGERKWTIEWFKKTYGDVKPSTGIDTDGCKEYISLGEYLDKFDEYSKLDKGKSIPYLRTWYFSDDIPELVDDFTPPSHFHASDAFLRLPEDLRPPFRWLFFGPAGTQSKMHVDIWETDAWLGMLQGDKTFTLYHPAHRKLLEVGDNVWPDILSPPKTDKFPRQAEAVPAQTLLKAGEIIYIPRKWPHHAVAQSPSISLTLNFAPTVVKTQVAFRGEGVGVKGKGNGIRVRGQE